MQSLDELLKMGRARRALTAIANRDRYRMACGDSRLVTMLYNFGAVRLVDRKDREITTSWEITPLGVSKL
jgi:hypothetical protein